MNQVLKDITEIFVYVTANYESAPRSIERKCVHIEKRQCFDTKVLETSSNNKAIASAVIETNLTVNNVMSYFTKEECDSIPKYFST